MSSSEDMKMAAVFAEEYVRQLRRVSEAQVMVDELGDELRAIGRHGPREQRSPLLRNMVKERAELKRACEALHRVEQKLQELGVDVEELKGEVDG